MSPRLRYYAIIHTSNCEKASVHHQHLFSAQGNCVGDSGRYHHTLLSSWLMFPCIRVYVSELTKGCVLHVPLLLQQRLVCDQESVGQNEDVPQYLKSCGEAHLERGQEDGTHSPFRRTICCFPVHSVHSRSGCRLNPAANSVSHPTPVS